VTFWGVQNYAKHSAYKKQPKAKISTLRGFCYHGTVNYSR